MIRFFNRYRKTIIAFFVLLHCSQIFGSYAVYALTSGPSQPELQGFQPAGTTDMVDLFTGDFSYNIPLFELPGPNGGYPFNLSYQAGAGMDQEASWVGLNWSLNPGTINRQMRGLPDEFKGDGIYTKSSIAPSVTIGLGTGSAVELFGGAMDLSLGFSVYRNNYSGMGYSIDTSIGYGSAVGSSMTAGVGLNLKLDSKEGISVSPSLGLGSRYTGTVGAGADYNSKDGLSSLTFSYSTAGHRSREAVIFENKDIPGQYHVSSKAKRDMSGSATLNFASAGYTPQISLPMRTLNLSTTFKIGASWWGVSPMWYVTGFYAEQHLKNDKKRVRSGAYGYFNYQESKDGSDLLDFNREKDGMVTKESPNLAIPSLTYDIYSVTGQGISTMYRPMRNDIGIVHDQQVESTSQAASAGVDVGIPSHVGLNLTYNHSKSISGQWVDKNEVRAKVGFQDHTKNDLYEPWYFKAHGEPAPQDNAALMAIGNTDAVRIALKDGREDPSADDRLENNNKSIDIPSSSGYNKDRKYRNQVIQPITNEQLLGASANEMLPLFKVKYDSAGSEIDYKRSSLPSHHTAGFTALTPEGLRYNYGIPAYNLSQEEIAFSARKEQGDPSRVKVKGNGKGDPTYEYSDTDKYLRRVEMPKYAHSYLLTSIVGPDYVDVFGDGVTSDDLGYWVKFTYRKTTTKAEPYQWREPFAKAHLQEGYKTDPRDDKGSFIYGQKELWYLVKAETKSHIATFSLDERKDGKGVNRKLQDTNEVGKAVCALKEIKLFTRAGGEAYPIKVVKFKYNYSLCQNVFNNSSSIAAESGKLTLKELWFEYGASSRGSLNPYVFDYHETVPEENPSYSLYAYDRWGNYKPFATSDQNIDFPYSEQDPAKEAEINRNAAVWSLKEITLPSGGKVKIDYESDDYGYVQHKPAMQMTGIVDNGNPSDAKIELNDSDLRVKFKLETPIEGVMTPAQQREIVMKYLDQKRGQVYFKMKMNLRSKGEGFYEFVSGYADIDFSKTDSIKLEKAGAKYTYGMFMLKAESGRHPFSLRAWQHLRMNQPDLMNSGKRLQATNSTSERVDQIKSLGNIFTHIRQMFQGFYDYCSSKGWGREVEVGKSWIRLQSPDKKKYGGGLRVRQVTMTDEWAHDDEGVYGQIYEYTIDEDGESISSGVAAYEPMVGGDENALRYAKKYTQSVPLRSANNLFFEYPINESYYPGPQVGYRKVTVTSLAGASLAGKKILAPADNIYPKGSNVSYGISGITVHEFYTAKEFPVITEETEKANKNFNMAFTIPFVGAVSMSKLSTSQGYSIVTNDMHGRPYKVSNYRQDKAGKAENTPISWVKYNYAIDSTFYQQEKISTLNNLFIDNQDGTLRLATAAEINNGNVPKISIGQENEFFIDMRQFEDITLGGGLNYNIDAIYLLFGVIPVPTAWPNISSSFKQLRTAVTNKVIFKSGVLVSTEAYDGGSTILTQNRKWDKKTGATVLTEVNNNFDAPVYSYSILAHNQYAGMGAAYQNIGLKFDITGVSSLPYHDNYYEFNAALIDKLYPGDEILLYHSGSGFTKPVAKVTFTGNEDGDRFLYSETVLNETSYDAMITRSGYRNQLSVSAGSITALQDPSLPGSIKTYTKQITLPKE